MPVSVFSSLPIPSPWWLLPVTRVQDHVRPKTVITCEKWGEPLGVIG